MQENTCHHISPSPLNFDQQNFFLQFLLSARGRHLSKECNCQHVYLTSPPPLPHIRDLINRRKLFSIPVAEYASVSYQARTRKTALLSLISSFSKYYFKTDIICLLLKGGKSILKCI